MITSILVFLILGSIVGLSIIAYYYYLIKGQKLNSINIWILYGYYGLIFLEIMIGITAVLYITTNLFNYITRPSDRNISAIDNLVQSDDGNQDYSVIDKFFAENNFNADLNIFLFNLVGKYRGALDLDNRSAPPLTLKEQNRLVNNLKSFIESYNQNAKIKDFVKNYKKSVKFDEYLIKLSPSNRFIAYFFHGTKIAIEDENQNSTRMTFDSEGKNRKKSIYYCYYALSLCIKNGFEETPSKKVIEKCLLCLAGINNLIYPNRQ